MAQRANGAAVKRLRPPVVEVPRGGARRLRVIAGATERHQPPVTVDRAASRSRLWPTQTCKARLAPPHLTASSPARQKPTTASAAAIAASVRPAIAQRRGSVHRQRVLAVHARRVLNQQRLWPGSAISHAASQRLHAMLAWSDRANPGPHSRLPSTIRRAATEPRATSRVSRSVDRRRHLVRIWRAQMWRIPMLRARIVTAQSGHIRSGHIKTVAIAATARVSALPTTFQRS